MKLAVQQDLKQQMVTHKKNMIDAVETKCHEMDIDLDSIKSMIDQAIIVNIPPAVNEAPLA